MALRSSHILILAATAALFIFLSCSKKNSYEGLIEYIKAERDLRSRIGQIHGIEDSVKVLSEKHGIDLSKSYNDLIDHPEAWVDILQALKNEK